jgi:hypothetical protein
MALRDRRGFLLLSKAGPPLVVLGLYCCPHLFSLMLIDRRPPPGNSGRSVGLLRIEGDVDEARKQLCQLLGAGDCASRIGYNQQTGAVLVDFTGIDLATNEGALLLGQIVHGEYAYELTIGSQYRTAAGLKSLGTDAIVNNSNTFDPIRFRTEKPARVRPPEGVDALVAIDPLTARFRDSEGRSVPLAAIVFHELAEAYSKVDLQKPYLDFELGMMFNHMIVVTPTTFQQGAHNDAVQREMILRSQRLDLQATGRAGDTLTRDADHQMGRVR